MKHVEIVPLAEDTDLEDMRSPRMCKTCYATAWTGGVVWESQVAEGQELSNEADAQH